MKPAHFLILPLLQTLLAAMAQAAASTPATPEIKSLALADGPAKGRIGPPPDARLLLNQSS